MRCGHLEMDAAFFGRNGWRRRVFPREILSLIVCYSLGWKNSSRIVRYGTELSERGLCSGCRRTMSNVSSLFSNTHTHTWEQPAWLYPQHSVLTEYQVQYRMYHVCTYVGHIRKRWENALKCNVTRGRRLRVSVFGWTRGFVSGFRRHTFVWLSFELLAQTNVTADPNTFRM